MPAPNQVNVNLFTVSDSTSSNVNIYNSSFIWIVLKSSSFRFCATWVLISVFVDTSLISKPPDAVVVIIPIAHNAEDVPNVSGVVTHVMVVATVDAMKTLPSITSAISSIDACLSMILVMSSI